MNRRRPSGRWTRCSVCWPPDGPRPVWPDTLAGQGISYLVVRNDLDPETSRSARPILVHRAVDGSPGLTQVAQFGDPVGPGPSTDSSPTAGCDRCTRRWRSTALRRPAIRRHRTWPMRAGCRGWTADRKSFCALMNGAGCRVRALGPVLLTQDARAAGIPLPPSAGVIVTDTPVARETDYGRVDDHLGDPGTR